LRPPIPLQSWQVYAADSGLFCGKKNLFSQIVCSGFLFFCSNFFNLNASLKSAYFENHYPVARLWQIVQSLDPRTVKFSGSVSLIGPATRVRIIRIRSAIEFSV